jgi:hypothetical protein
MRAQMRLAAVLIPVIAGIASAPVHRLPSAVRHSATPPEGPQSSTLDDQTDLAVTVYNSDIALVRDVRTIVLPTGTFHLRFMFDR